MKRMLVLALLLFYSVATLATREVWIEHTYHNESDNPIKVITHYTQIMQRFTQPKLRRRITSKKIKGCVAHTLNPHETKTVTLKGDPLSCHRLVVGNINIIDLEEHDHAVVPKHNAQKRFDFVIARNKRDKLTIRPLRS